MAPLVQLKLLRPSQFQLEDDSRAQGERVFYAVAACFGGTPGATVGHDITFQVERPGVLLAAVLPSMTQSIIMNTYAYSCSTTTV